MEELIKEMNNLMEEVHRVQINYKKDGEDRKNISYLSKRITLIQDYQNQLKNLNEEIINKYVVTEPEHQYFKNDYFKNCDDLCHNILYILSTKLNENSSKLTNICEKTQPEQTLFKQKDNDEKDDDDQQFKPNVSSKQAMLNSNQTERFNRQEAKVEMINRNIYNLNQDLNNKGTTAGVLKKKLELLNKYWEAFSKTHDDIAANATEHDQNKPYFLNNLYGIIEEEYLETTIRVEDKLDSIMSLKSKDTREYRTNPFEIKLPTIEIPSFHGDYSKWRSFHDVFKKLIHDNQSLTDTHRMNYLKTSISGSASKLISHLSITEDNYETAWNILKQRYDNKRLIASNHINAILSLQSYNVESINGLRIIHDTTKENLHALENLGIDVESWGPIIIQILTQKLDRETHKLYETTLTDPREIQETSTFLEFLEQRFQSLEAVNYNYKPNTKSNFTNQTQVASRTSNYNQNNNFSNANRNQSTYNTNKYQKNSYFVNSSKTEEATSLQKLQPLRCWKCNDNHALKSCTEFQKLTIKDRINFVNQNNLCYNCLSSWHSVKRCTSNYRCLQCKSRHHSLLHEVNITKNVPTQHSTHISTRQPTTSNEFRQIQPNPQPSEPRNLQVQSHISNNISQSGNILLGTALVKTFTKYGKEELLRMLIDSGSQATFITEDACQRLNLNKKSINAEISGMGGITAGVSRNIVELNIQPRFPSIFSLNIQALVFKKLTKQLPEQQTDPWQWNHLQNLLWADPNFACPGPIDIIIGADYYSDIISNEIIKGHHNEPIAQKTEFGWTILGKSGNNQRTIKIQSMVAQTEVDNQLKSFWELEEIQTERQFNQEEIECEKFYEKTHSREEDGRYTVQIPFKKENLKLGNSRQTAVARLLQVEKRLAKDINLRQQYQEFMEEYIKLNHMKLVNSTNETESNEQKHFFLPHHPVIKESSTTTKLRVVFDGSAKTKSGNSLNDLMMTGPTIQQDIISIIMRWRKHKYVYTADIEKMFRQIKLTNEHQDYHKILWRQSTNEPIKEYNLATVTYGTTAATYLSVKTLQQLAVDDRSSYPIASKIVLNDFYVDDLMSGNDSIEDAIIAQNQLTRLLKGGGFNLRKWSSNNKEILDILPEESRAFSNIDISKDEILKTLGISWNPTSDTFEFKVNLELNQKIETKRKVLSEVAKLFDPLGWLAPIIITAKILMQDLWLAGVSWDEPLPTEIVKKWSMFRNTLSTIEEIKIPRWTNNHQNQICELHGFCDASEKAYAAVIYMKIINQDGKFVITLIAAKTKVAPIKQKISLPRLELCGALLLAKLMKMTTKAMQIPDVTSFAWTDSTIVLAWIRGQPNKFKTFVANRISEIHNRTQPSQWRHVRSEDNPADCASRGLAPTELKTHKIWWDGPTWLKLSSEHWPKLETKELTTDLESKQKLVVLTATKSTSTPLNELIQRCSSIRKLISVIAYCRRYLHNLKHKLERKIGSLTTTELDFAKKYLVKYIQTEEYLDDIKFYKQNKMFNQKSKIISLNPFIDEDNIIRVGGRLQQSSFGYNQTHPIIIPNCYVAKLLIEEAHQKTLHGGTSLTMAFLRQRYWVINSRNLTRQIVHKCVKCHRYNSKNLNQIMGNLPAVRVTPSRPFTHTGVDYAGPIQVRMSKGRGNKSHKGWIAIFICLATKAIHIELVSDLTSEGFLAAFKRFVSRRGLCSHIYSDNGTNFVGADKILQQDLKKAILETQNAVTEVLAKDGIQWHFIPPASPHFGGLWEAGVKSIKYHLRRVIGETTLTFEEMTTMLAQIEACLNSRPLCPMTSDPTDLEVLTPGHFLIGGSLLSSPEPCLTFTKSSRLLRWRLTQKLTQDFWNAWSTEYVSRMQQRPKWLTKSKNIDVGQLVLIKDEQNPPSRWALGRVTKTHPGKDGINRVVTLKTKEKEILRPIVKISPLPIKDNEEELFTMKTNVNVNTIIRNIKPTSTRTAQYKMNPIIWILTIIAIFTNVKSQQSNHFTIQPFISQPGIYFEHFGTTNLINNQWNIIVYYDLKNYQLEFEGYKNAVTQLTKLHDKLYVDMSIVLISQSILNQFEHHLSTMRAKDMILRSINKEDKTRTKRGLINAVGYVAHTLFGVLDEDFAEQYEHEIKNIQSNENHLLNLIKKQTSIVEATTNIIKKTELIIQRQFKEFDEHIRGLSEDLQRLDEDLNKQEVIHQFSLLTMNTMLMMTSYEKTQDALIDLLFNIQNGKLTMQLLTFSQLREQINIIKSNIQEDLKIPASNNPIEMFKLLSAKARLFEEKIIIHIEVPLAQMDDFQIFHLISVPTAHQDYFIKIVPSTTYLAVNLQRDRYYPLTEFDLSHCTSTKKDHWLCKQSHAIYNLKSNVSSCEMAILNHEEHLPTCHVESTEVVRTWIRLQRANSWIYVFNQKYTVDIICNKTIMSLKLEGSGILHLLSNCIIKEPSMQIKSNNLFSSEIQASFHPPTNLSEIVEKNKIKIHQLKIQLFPLNNSREIEVLQNKISLQKELETRKITELTHHDIHQYVVVYLLLAVLLSTGIIIAVKKKMGTTRTRTNCNVPPLCMT